MRRKLEEDEEILMDRCVLVRVCFLLWRLELRESATAGMLRYAMMVSLEFSHLLPI
jgi:hypothetical protein